MVLSCKCHTFGSKLPWLRVVSAILLGRDSRGVGYAGLQDNETTSGAVAGGASQELRNYGTTNRASRLKAQSSVTLYTLYTFYTLYTQSSLLTVVMR